MKLVNVQIIKDELERLIRDYRFYSSAEAKYRHEAYKELSEWLDGLDVKDDMDTIHPIEDVVSNDPIANSYKEKYEQALEVAKETYNKQPMFREWLEKMFPELKESEDERIREALIRFHKSTIDIDGIKGADIISWLEKQGNREIYYSQNHQDSDHPNGCIVLEDFNGGEGFYKLNLDYLNKKQVEEVEEMVRTWNKESKTSNENIKSCIGMCLTDVNEQRFNDYNTTLKDCLAWLEKQGEKKPEENKGNIGKISPNWSEEDEHRIKDTIYFLDTAKKHYASTEELDACIDWLKSLKQRIGG